MIFGQLAVARGDVAHRVLEGLLAQAGAAPGGSFGSTLVFIALMLGIFYLLLWRPQQKQAKEHRTMLAALKKGDVVVTSGGVLGKVHSVADKFVVVEIARDVKMRVLTSSIASKAPEGMLEEPEVKAEKDKAEKEPEKKK